MSSSFIADVSGEKLDVILALVFKSAFKPCDYFCYFCFAFDTYFGFIFLFAFGF